MKKKPSSGGIPTSLDNSSQQWDFPNAWPPLQSIIVQGLRQTNYPPALDVAKELAFTWLQSNYLGFNQSMKMYEKVSISCIKYNISSI